MTMAMEMGGRVGGEITDAPGDVRGADKSANAFDISSVKPDRMPLIVMARFRPDMLDAYAATGHDLIPLHAPQDLGQDGKPLGKAPVGKGWRERPALSLPDARRHMDQGKNIGVRLRASDLVIDVDPRHFDPDDDPLARLGADLDVDLSAWPTIVTGSGGRHIYMLKPSDTSIRASLDGYNGLEFKTAGTQVVAAGSVHPGGGLYAWDDDVLAVPLRGIGIAPAALIDLIRRPKRPGCVDAGSRTPEQLAEMLSGLDVLGYNGQQDRWQELMMACHHATAGDGREEFIAWSIGDPQYADHDEVIGRRWDSLHADASGKRITEKTLFKALVDAGRSDLLPKDDPKGDFPDDFREPDRVGDEWVWVADAEQFVRRGDCKKWTTTQWKSVFGSLMPDGDIITQIQRGKYPMKKFEALVYAPGIGEFPDGPTGPRYNIWRPSGVVPKPGDVAAFLDHMAYLVPDETERDHVLDYLSLVVQPAAPKVNFALLIRGRQGTGKSWLGQLLVRMIGERNVVMPSNEEVLSRWTGWLEGRQLGILEEMMTSGRQDVANRLKTVISEPTVRIEDKGCKIYSIPNRTNLICFTNHDDALPIEHGDRRWLVVFSPAEPRSESYYSDLFAYLDADGPSAVKHMLLNRAVKLNPKGVAPTTVGKQDMRRLALSEAEAFLLDRFEQKAAPFDFDLVRLDDLVAAVPAEIGRRGRGNVTKQATQLLRTEIGAVSHTRYTKGDGRPSWSLWSVRSHDHWESVGAAARIDAFLEHVQSQ